MKRSRLSEEQIIAILREQEAGAKTVEVCRKHGISDATFGKWKAKYGVLPFANMSGDPEQEYFADGMVEEIITLLSRIRWLFVIAKRST